MKARSLDRIAAVVSVVLLGTLGLVTFYLAQVSESEERSRVPRVVAPDRPDYFVERMSLLTMNEQGDPSYRLEASQLQHFPQDDVADFEDPVMVSLDPARPRVTITANRGRLIQGGEEARLSGNVVVTRAATDKTAPMKVETEYAVVRPDEDIVRTDWPVAVIQGGQQLNGVGMELNNRTRQLRVDSQVRVVVPPPAPPAGAPASGASAPAGGAR
ncbi:MAG: LPS export ABC transporter periplasmic protein LptC [Burkholderiales bacterium]|nr:MAG: LPS export ABC transporter periplasmic protein LptC [Burkholderiales bacterium]